MKTIDARGLACPEPVVRVQRSLQSDAEGVAVTVDNFAAVENISRFASARGYAVEKNVSGAETTLVLTKNA